VAPLAVAVDAAGSLGVHGGVELRLEEDQPAGAWGEGWRRNLRAGRIEIWIGAENAPEYPVAQRQPALWGE